MKVVEPSVILLFAMARVIWTPDVMADFAKNQTPLKVFYNEAGQRTEYLVTVVCTRGVFYLKHVAESEEDSWTELLSNEDECYVVAPAPVDRPDGEYVIHGFLAVGHDDDAVKAFAETGKVPPLFVQVQWEQGDTTWESLKTIESQICPKTFDAKWRHFCGSQPRVPFGCIERPDVLARTDPESWATALLRDMIKEETTGNDRVELLAALDA